MAVSTKEDLIMEITSKLIEQIGIENTNKAKVCQGDTLSEPIVKEEHRVFYTPTYRIF